MDCPQNHEGFGFCEPVSQDDESGVNRSLGFVFLYMVPWPEGFVFPRVGHRRSEGKEGCRRRTSHVLLAPSIGRRLLGARKQAGPKDY